MKPWINDSFINDSRRMLSDEWFIRQWTMRSTILKPFYCISESLVSSSSSTSSSSSEASSSSSGRELFKSKDIAGLTGDHGHPAPTNVATVANRALSILSSYEDPRQGRTESTETERAIIRGLCNIVLQRPSSWPKWGSKVAKVLLWCHPDEDGL